MSESVAISRTDLAKVTEQRFVRNGCVCAYVCVCMCVFSAVRRKDIWARR